MNRPFHILLADNHVGFRREVRKILEDISGVKVTGEAGNRHELFELLRQSQPQLVILDMSLPDLRAREGTQFIKTNYPGTQVLLTVLGQEKEYQRHGMAAGAVGVMPKQYAAREIALAIEAVRQGKIYMPPQAPGKIFSPRYGAVDSGVRALQGAGDSNGDISA